MLRFFTLSGVMVFASALAFADSFTGKLLDASCTCAPTASTAAFALQVSGKTLKLDADGNKKAADAMKASNTNADRSKDPNSPDSQITAKVEGTVAGDEIKVESIQVQ